MRIQNLLILKSKWYSIFLCILFINTLQAQDCNTLRGKNESYGAGDTNVSWCAMKSKTPYTKCMCEQEQETKRLAAKRQSLVQKALAKSTEANDLFNQVYNMATQASIDKDLPKLNASKDGYNQVIALNNEAKEFIEQAYAGSDSSYNNLIDMYFKLYDKQIEWATMGLEYIDIQENSININENGEKYDNQSSKNNWAVKIEPQKKTLSAPKKTSSDKVKQTPKQTYCSEWTTQWGTCLAKGNKAGLKYQKCYIKETATHVVFKITLKPTPEGINTSLYRKGIKIFVGEKDPVIMDCYEFNKTGYTIEVSIVKNDKYNEWDSDKKAFYNKVSEKYKLYAGSLYIECLF